MNKKNLNKGWYFWKEKNEDHKALIDLPHDAMLLEERQPDMDNGSASGYFPGGKYYYSKKFYADSSIAGKHVILEFEGIYMDSSVYLNGEKLGGWIYGYTNFYIDLTGKLIKNQENEILVIVDNSNVPNSRWYSGSGIYRPVSMFVGDQEFIFPEGIKVKTKSIIPAVVEVTVNVSANTEVQVITEIYKDGIKVSEGVGTQFVTEIPNACLWSAESPYLYEARTCIMKGNEIIDQEKVTFGIRSIEWSAQKGLQINQKTVKLKGGCVHHDNGPLGAATNDKAEYRKLKKMKSIGYNAVRYSHYPAGKNFLDCCDKLGLYVIDETFDQWKIPQTKYDYAMYFDQYWEKDITAMVDKDYNHPSVIMYCVGNEITDTGLPHGGAVCKMICNKIKDLDSSRPTTIAINSMLSVLADIQAKKAASEIKNGNEKKIGSKEVNDIITLLPKIMASITAESLEELIHDVVSEVDIVGYNYSENLYERIHEMFPERVILSSETFPSKIGTNWDKVDKNNYLIGDFMWTAWDYLGEAGVGLPVYGIEEAPFNKQYPCLTAGCGSIDLTGHIESQGRYTSVIFGAEKKPIIAVRPLNHSGEKYTLGKWRLTDAVESWSWPGEEGKTAEVEVYSIGETVELLVNERSYGKKKLVNSRCDFQCEYRPGSVTAISYDECGERIACATLLSATEVKQISLIPEEAEIKADGEDLAYIQIEIADENGVCWMLCDKRLTVQVEGAGRLKALANGNPETEDSYTGDNCMTYNGRMVAIIQSNGEIGDIAISVYADEKTRTQLVLKAIS